MSESGKGRALALAAFVLLAAISVYGFRHEHLPQQPLWNPPGGKRFLAYAAVYWAAAAVLLLAAPRWLGVAAGAFVLIYTAWWSGPIVPLAVLYFFGACFLTGKILTRHADGLTATLVGVSAAIFLVWIALHFRVNYRSVYIATLALPYAWEARRLREHARGFRWRCESRGAAAALAVLLFVLMAQWLVALMPEVSDDGLTAHLTVPLAVAQEGRWSFDFLQYVWALMPAGGESVFTGASLAAGPTHVEAAAKLANFALLAILSALIVQACRRRLSPAQSYLAAALFISTPLVQLVTGSLFVENLWAAMIAGACFALLRYEESGVVQDLRVAALLLGTAFAVKVGSALFLAPMALIAGWSAMRRCQLRALIPAVLLLVAAAVPTYLYAFIKSGDPIFPFANAVFRSPYFDSARSFVDGRFLAPLSWRTPYLATFRSGSYIEGQAGAAGFQYFLLVLPAAILAVASRKRAPLLLLGIASFAALALFASTPNLRYLYPALPLFSVAIGVVCGALPGSAAVFVILTAINCWFLPSSGWYDKEFASFHKAEAEDSVVVSSPVRLMFARLNQTDPGAPAVVFDSDVVAGLHGPVFVNNWHSNVYWRRADAARTPTEIADILRGFHVRNIVAPASLRAENALLEAFLREWAEPTGIEAGRMALFHLRDAPGLPPPASPALPPGAWDDLDDRIQYSGKWIHEPGLSGPLSGTASYSGRPGDSFHLSFNGSGITYIFAKAFNRGIAQISIDGKRRARVDMYSRTIEWQSKWTVDGLTPGIHTLEVRILKEKNPGTKETWVDLDGVVVAP